MIIAGLVGGALILLARVLFVVFVVKKAIDFYRAQQAAVHRDVAELERVARESEGDGPRWRGLLQAAHEMEAAVDRRARVKGAAPAAVSAQFMAAWLKAQNEFNQLDSLRRQQADLHMADIKFQAASMGLFL